MSGTSSERLMYIQFTFCVQGEEEPKNEEVYKKLESLIYFTVTLDKYPM